MDTDISQPQKPAEPVQQKAEPVTSTKTGRPRGRLVLKLVILVILVAIAIGWSWWLFGRNNTTAFNENQNIDTGGYQAVFLSNGQVYFGKLADLNNKYVTITDIYYLQVQSNGTNANLQGSKDDGSSDSQVSLAKLGSELHGPKDKMYIASDQMLFWENLKSDSKVVQAIQKYQAGH